MNSMGKGLELEFAGATTAMHAEIVSPLPFDGPTAKKFSEARAKFLDRFFVSWSGPPLRTAYDAGTGVGFFAGHLAECHGMKVKASDLRQSNIEEARKRHPTVEFLVGDLEDPTIKSLGQFDVVTAFGLLYHLENPFRAVRTLAAMTERVLIIESLIAPGRGCRAWLLDEFPGVDQASAFVAWHLTESALVKMIYKAGIPHVYRARFRPMHDQFRRNLIRRRTRAFVFGSRTPLGEDFERIPEPCYRLDRAYYLGWPWRALLRSFLEWRRKRNWSGRAQITQSEQEL